MKITACAYPPDWAQNEMLALPVFSDQAPARGIAGRIDFRLNGLISGLILEQLLKKDDPWLLINLERKVAPRLLLASAGEADALTLDSSAKSLQRTAAKLFNAGARSYALDVGDLYRPEFPIREFAGNVLRSLIPYQLEQVKLYVGLNLADKLVQELGRWLHYYKPEAPVEFSLRVIPEMFEEPEK